MRNRTRRLLFLAGVVLTAWTNPAGATVRGRALLVGINDYSASGVPRLPGTRAPLPVADRGWKNLAGSVNDVVAMRETLVCLYGFDPNDIVTLTDERATRAAILDKIETHLLAASRKGEIAFFWFSGHGSQVLNLRSEEPDKLDESLVPADSRLGAPDIRDKELRALFNRILDAGARLTVVLDTCYSGSVFRDPSAPAGRGVEPDRRDVSDPATGRRPEDRGAVIVAAAQDHEAAFETRDEQGRPRGLFSFAWLHALREAAPGEPLLDTFLRARARLSAAPWPQHPVLAANDSARGRPFLGTRTDRRGGRAVVPVDSIRRDGTVMLGAGWLNGLTVGSELREIGGDALLATTALTDLAHAEARLLSSTVKTGTLLEMTSWVAPPPEVLRVQMPQGEWTVAELTAIAEETAASAAKKKIEWVVDPVEKAPSHVLRWSGRSWELLQPNSPVRRMASPEAAVRSLPAAASLFVQWPAPARLAARVALGAGTQRTAVERAGDARDAAYVLAGRFAAGRLEFAWLKSLTAAGDRPEGPLPLRTEWQDAGLRATPHELTEAALRLQRIRAWQLLDSPPAAAYPYQLALRRTRDLQLVRDTVEGGTDYTLVLRAPHAPESAKPQYVYAFVVDSFGRSTLLFPRNASVENWFPIPSAPAQAPAEIALGRSSAFVAAAPYGFDTYLLLTTDEPLANPWVLQWDGVRKRDGEAVIPLEALLAAVGSAERSSRPLPVPANWSIQRVVLRAVPPGTVTARSVRPNNTCP